MLLYLKLLKFKKLISNITLTFTFKFLDIFNIHQIMQVSKKFVKNRLFLWKPAQSIAMDAEHKIAS